MPLPIGQFGHFNALHLAGLLTLVGCSAYLWGNASSRIVTEGAEQQGCEVVVVSLRFFGAWTSLDLLLWGRNVLTSVSVVVVIGVLSYHMHRNKLGNAQVIWTVHEAMRDPQYAAAVIGHNMPVWLSFPAVERSQWMQNVVTSRWPGLDKATEKMLVTCLDPILAKYCPPFLTKLRCGCMKMGSVPLTVRGIQGFAQTNHETVIDFHLDWVGNPDLRVVACMGPIEVETRLSNFQFKCILRVTLGPHVEVYPGFAAISFAFVGKPLVDFALATARLSLDAIPGLSSWLDAFVRDTLMWLMVHPKRYVYALMDAGYGEQQSSAEPTGTLEVVVKGCDGLANRGIFSTTSPYVTARLTSGEAQFRTATVSKDRDPRFPQPEPFKFLVYNVPNERLLLRVFQDSHETVISKVGNAIKQDECIGEAELFVASLLGGRRVGSSALSLRNTNKKQGNSLGNIIYQTEFIPFESTSSPSSSFLQTGGVISGVLLVHLKSAKGLVKADLLGKSDPYVILKVGVSRVRSKMIPKTLNPEWDQKLELDVADAMHDVMRLEVWDADIVKDTVIGTCSIPIAEVLASNRRLNHTWPLTPQGTISMELKLMMRKPTS